MSAATLERERGDDRDPEVEIQKLQEMYDQPSAPEPIHVYEHDAPKTEKTELQAGAGDLIFEHRVRRGMRGPVGTVIMRQVHIRPAAPKWIN